MSATATPIGKFVWYEYMGDDLKAAVDFYSHVLGWTAQDGGMTRLRISGRLGRGDAGRPA